MIDIIREAIAIELSMTAQPYPLKQRIEILENIEKRLRLIALCPSDFIDARLRDEPKRETDMGSTSENLGRGYISSEEWNHLNF